MDESNSRVESKQILSFLWPCDERSLPEEDDTQPVLLLPFPVQTMLRVKQKPRMMTIMPTTMMPQATAVTDGPKAWVKKAHFKLKPMTNQMKPAKVVKKPQ